jgi:hypothetical protein
VIGGVGVLQLDRVGEHAERGEEGALELVDQLAAVDRPSDLAEQQVLVGEGVLLDLPDLDRLLESEEIVDFLGQRPGAGDDAQRAVGVEPLHDREVVVEGHVQLVDRDRRDVLDAVRPGEPAGEAAGDHQAFIAAGSRGDRDRDRYVSRARLHVGAHIGTAAACL